MLVDADCVAFLTVDVLRGEVVCVDGAHDVEAVAVVGGDEDEGLLEGVRFLEVRDGGFDGVVEFKEFAERAIVIEHVHHLVNGGGFRHEEVALVAGAGLEDVNGLEGHFLETGLVEGGLFVTGGRERLVEVLAVDVAVEPFGHIGGSENTESLVLGVGSLQSGAVLDDLVVLLGELVEVVLALICLSTKRRRIELLSTTAEENIDGYIGPSVVLNTVEVGVNNSLVLATRPGMGDESSRCGIGNVRSGNNTNMAASETVEHLSNGLHFGVIEGVLAGVGVDVQAVDGALVSSVERSSRVGRIGDEAVNRVGHLVTENREFVHGHGALVLSVDGLVCDQACGRDHVGGHTITNEENDVLGLALLSQVANEPGSLSAGAIVVGESGSVLAWLVKCDAAVGLGRDVDQSRLLGIAGKEIFEVLVLTPIVDSIDTYPHTR